MTQWEQTNHMERTQLEDLTADPRHQTTRPEDQSHHTEKTSKKTYEKGLIRNSEILQRGLEQTGEIWDSVGLDSPPPACNAFCWGGLCPSWCRLRNSPLWRRSLPSGSGGCSSAAPLQTHLCHTHIHIWMTHFKQWYFIVSGSIMKGIIWENGQLFISHLSQSSHLIHCPPSPPPNPTPIICYQINCYTSFTTAISQVFC